MSTPKCNLRPLISYADRRWYYDPATRNIVAEDGAIVCRTGDTVCTDPGIAELLANAPALYQALLGMVAYHDSKFPQNRQAALNEANAALRAAQPKQV